MTDLAPNVQENMHSKQTGQSRKQKLEQYFSSEPLAQLMASMMDYREKTVKILDPGAGAGSLFLACVKAICSKKNRPDRIEVTSYEIDRFLSDQLDDALSQAESICDKAGISFTGHMIRDDFVRSYAESEMARFTHVIMNPPYKKINASSKQYRLLRSMNLRTTNLYSAFVSIACSLLKDGGQMTFISPRSFCNGAYFQPFRRRFLESMSVRRIHRFNSRRSSFDADGVLQENIIVCAKKCSRRGNLLITSSYGPGDPMTRRRMHTSDVILEDDPQHFIHIVPDKLNASVSYKMRNLKITLQDLGIKVSTGKVIDFRMSDALRFHNVKKSVPLVRSSNISRGITHFPIYDQKHHNFIIVNESSRKRLIKNDVYVLVKRFTTMEEKKRIVASIWTKDIHNSDLVGFENKTNYFHCNGSGLDELTAKGLWMFLNSTIVDSYFRQFNGHTQVNATDLRYLKYPTSAQLKRLGNIQTEMNQEKIDEAVQQIFLGD